ncbi:MAG: DUF6056 family protein [bacterium]
MPFQTSTRPGFAEKLRIPLLVVLAGAFLVPLVAHIHIGLFNRYLADDYCVANEVRSKGVRGAVSFWYLNWHGSVLFDLFASLGGLLPPRLVRFWPAFALTTLTGLLSWAVWQSRPAWRRWDRILVSVVLAEMTLAVLLDGPPEMTPQAVYWLDGALRYLAPQLFLVAYIGVVFHAQGLARARRRQWAWCGVAGVLAMSAGLFSETHMAAQITGLVLASLACACFVPAARRMTVIVLLIAGVGGSMLALLVTVVAPGTMVRQGLFPDPPGMLDTGLWTLGYTRDYLVEVAGRTPWNLVLTTVVPALLAWLVGDLGNARDREQSTRPPGQPWLLVIPFITVVALAATFAPTAWAASSFPPVRSLLVSQVVLFGGLATWSYLLGHSTRAHMRPQHVYRLRPPLVVALLLVTIWPLGIGWRTFALRAEANAYARTWESFDQQLREARTQGINAVRVPAPENFAGLEVVGPDTAHWVNGCVSAFYGVSVTGYPPPPLPNAVDLQVMDAVGVDVGGIAIITDSWVRQTYAEPGGTLSVTVRWLPRMRTEVPHRVFIDLNDSTGRSIAQHTTAIAEGAYNTTVWAPGRPFLATYTIGIPKQAEPTGNARLILGLYDESTLQRLPWEARGGARAHGLADVRIATSGCGRGGYSTDNRVAASRRMDANIENAVTRRFVDDALVGPLQIEARVYESVVSLCDDDTSGDERERAVEMARQVDGVVDVVDLMR